MKRSPRERRTIVLGTTAAAAVLALAFAVGATEATWAWEAAAEQPAPPAGVQTFALVAPQEVRALGVAVDAVDHAGHRALRLRGAPPSAGPSGASRLDDMAVVEGAHFRNGSIEVTLAGSPAAGAAEGARGFVGIAFRVAPDASRLECFYLRPTNGRADDQLRRNHATQYISHPGFPWHKLRADSPGVYESYVDLVPGEWTRMRIEVDGAKAKLFVHDAPQPVLVVNDLKLGAGEGGVALWIGDGTEAWFRDLRITHRD